MKKKSYVSAHLEDELLKKSPFTLINCIKLFIFPSRSTCRALGACDEEKRRINRLRLVMNACGGKIVFDATAFAN